MKKTLNVYFDYICPYCYRGITDLMELLPEFPGLSVNWVPCEAHPRPEPAFLHSDLANQAMIAVAEQGGDLLRFHHSVFQAHFVERRRIDDKHVLADMAADCGADRDKVLTALEKGLYRQTALDNNTLVWGKLGFEAVPCYQSDSLLLASREDVMISRKELRGFLEAVVNR